MAYISFQPSDYFNTKLYTGANKSVTGVGFQPDWVWIKQRNTASSALFDAVRGTTKYLESNGTQAETTDATTLTAFGSDGFTLGADSSGYVGGSSQATVSWNWKANGQGSSNTDGSINTTYTSANTTSGFSIIQYTGNSTSGATIGHGLGAVPKVFLCKKTNSSGDNWSMYHVGTGNTIGMTLNSSTASIANAKYWNNTTPTSSVITLGNGTEVNGNTDTFIGYAFAEKQGFSKFGSYVGNGNADGAFIYTGFTTAFVMIKRYDSGSLDWNMYDNKRLGYNGGDAPLFANLTNAESTDYGRIDLLSNGFKIRTSNDQLANNGGSFLYMAFAEHPLVASNGTPATAR